MTNNVYCLLNNLSSRYGDIYAFPTDAFAVSRLSTYILQGQKLDLSEFSLFCAGTVDIETGVITGSPLRPVSWQTHSVIEKEVSNAD